MKCGICKSDSPTYEYRSGSVLPVQDAGDLVQHKRQQHPAEYKAGMQQRKDTKAAHEQADRDYHERRKTAGLAAGRTVMYKWPYGEHEPQVKTTDQISTYDRLSDHRYPEPNAFSVYEGLIAAAKRNMDEAALALRLAFDDGAPVPQEDVDKVRAAMDAVQP